MMRTIGYVLTLALLVVFGCAGWKAVELMSSDAVGMAVGILFGLLPGFTAGILFCNLADRRRDGYKRPEYRRGDVVQVLPAGTALARRPGREVAT